MCNKISFTQREAEHALKRGKHGSKRRREKRMYYCPYHNAWHLTKTELAEPVEDIPLIHPERWAVLISDEIPI